MNRSEHVIEAYRNLSSDRPITRRELEALERVLDKLYADRDIDVEFTRHFHDRLNDPRNKRQITLEEVSLLFNDLYYKHGKRLSGMEPGAQAVVRDVNTDIHIPFALNLNMRTQLLELTAKTVMRKKDFRTSNPVLRV